MRTFLARTMTLACLLGFASSGCGSDSTATSAPPVDRFLPIISAVWRRVGGAGTYTMVLQSSDDGKATGSFTGTENHPTLGTSQLTGTFTNSIATFIIARAAGSLTFNGKFLGTDSLRLTRAVDTLIFVRP